MFITEFYIICFTCGLAKQSFLKIKQVVSKIFISQVK